ncbi:MAG: hypothetical protein ACR2OM_10565, partial [Aestuariivirgaceae bacterium]
MSQRRRDWLRVAILGGASMAGGPLIVAVALSFPLWASSIGAAMDWGTVFVGVFFQFAVFALPAGLLGILLGSWRVLYGRLKLWFLTIASVLTFSGWVGLLSIV